MDGWISDLTTEVLWAPTVEAARQGFRRMAGRAGVETYAYAHLDPTIGYLDTTYRQDWIDHYLGHTFLAVDPVLAEAGRTRLPFAWRLLCNRPGLGAGAARVMRDARQFGLREGLSVPFHDKNGFAGIVSLAFPSRERLREVVQGQPSLRLLALYYHSAIERLLEPAEAGSPELTAFERRCLIWLSAGRTLYEISGLTNRAEADIATALRAAREKLGVATAAQAAAKAVGQGLIVT